MQEGFTPPPLSAYQLIMDRHPECQLILNRNPVYILIKTLDQNHLELCCNGVFLSTYHGDLSLEHSVSTCGGYGACIPFRVSILFLNDNVSVYFAKYILITSQIKQGPLIYLNYLSYKTWTTHIS